MAITKNNTTKEVAKKVAPLPDDEEYRQRYEDNKPITLYAMYLNVNNNKVYYVNGFAKLKATGEKMVIYTDVETKELITRPVKEWFVVTQSGKPLHVEVNISNQ